MASVTSSTNSNSRDLDPVVLVSSGAARLKRAVPGSDKTASGVTPDTSAIEVGTHVDDLAFGVAVDTVMAVGYMADETSPDSVNEGDVGIPRMTLARNPHQVSVADAAAVTSVNSTAASQTLLAANANRIGALVFNTDANNLYLKFGATASATSFTIKIAAGGYYEFPHPVYRGVVDGIWDVDGSGAAVLTELT